jgi:acyl-CoA synthetase (AMP-forming)/AMP-acid ligase II
MALQPWCEAITMGDALLRTARERPDAPGLVMPERTWTWAELAEGAERVARGLVALGVQPRDHVGVLIPNGYECLTAMFGVALAGATAVPINARFQPPEMKYIVEHADLAAILTSDLVDDHADFVAMLGTAIPGLAEAPDPKRLDLPQVPHLRSVVLLGSKQKPGVLDRATFERLAEHVPREEIDRRRAGMSLGDLALILYTSGTTANPRGCMIPHEAIVRVWSAVAAQMGLGPDDAMWNPCPMFHIAALGVSIACIVSGATIVTARYFEPESSIELLSRHRTTAWWPAYPQLALGIINHPRFGEVDVSGLRRWLCVGPPETLAGLQDALPHTTLVTTFGMTESSGCSTFTGLDEDVSVRTSTVGRPLPGLEARVTDPETRAEVPHGTPGELELRGPLLCRGYYKDPDRTAETFGPDGWMRTGDRAVMDADGRLQYQARLKDVFKVGGENVSPSEVEAHLMTHPAVHLAQVVGVPDPRLDEVGAAFVELKPGAEATEEELIEYCRGSLARFKIPRYVRFVDSWPMSATKVQKFKLREQFVAEQSQPA